MLRIASSVLAVALIATQLGCAQQTVAPAPVVAGAPSPDSKPPCAGAVPAPRPPVDTSAPPVPAAPRPPLPPAITPNPIRQGAMPKHNCFLAVAKRGGVDLLFVGDSITDFFLRADRGQAVWNERFALLKAANFGISGDTTQDVMGRMQSGELDGFKAKLIVLMLGTNNIGRNDNADIAAGDAAILAEFRKHQPQAKVLLLGVFPRGNPTGTAQASVDEINTYLVKLADNKTVFYMDIGDRFRSPDRTISRDVMGDGLHPTALGYQI